MQTERRADVERVVAEGDGTWRSCTGCYSTNDGYPTAPDDTVFKVPLGMGCGECGGLGAIWDQTDYAVTGRDIERGVPQPAAEPVTISRDKLIEIVMHEATDALVADGWRDMGKPNILVQGCRYVRGYGPGYEKPEEAAHQFAGFIVDAILAKLEGNAFPAPSQQLSGVLSKFVDFEDRYDADKSVVDDEVREATALAKTLLSPMGARIDWAGMHALVGQVARMKHESEQEGGMSPDDAVDTLNSVITWARSLMGGKAQ